MKIAHHSTIRIRGYRSVFELIRILNLPPGSLLFLVDQVKITDVYDQAARLPENEHRVLLHYGVDKKQSAAAHAEIPEGERNDAFALSFARNPLYQESPGEQSLAYEAENEKIIVKAISDHVVEALLVDSNAHGGMFSVFQTIKNR